MQRCAAVLLASGADVVFAAQAVEAPAATAEVGWVGILAPLVALVLALFALLWWLRRGHRLRGGRGRGPLHVAQAVAVGTRERVVLVDAQGRRFLLGVTASRVELLAELEPAPDEVSATGPPGP